MHSSIQAKPILFGESILNIRWKSLHQQFIALQQDLPQKAQPKSEQLMGDVFQILSDRYQDSMTGLYNKRFFVEQLQEAFYEAKNNLGKMGLLVIDMDRFKPINDNFGHAYGDTAIKLVAQALKQQCQADNSYACRIGGDEFAVIVENADSTEQLETLAQSISQAIQDSDFSVPNYKKDGTRRWQLASSISAGLIDFELKASSKIQTPDDLFVVTDENLISIKKKARAKERRAKLLYRPAPPDCRNIVSVQSF